VIKLDKFNQEYIAIVPIVQGWGQVNQRKIYSPKTEDGWYQFRLSAQPELIRKATQLEIWKTLKDKKVLRVYALGQEGIPVNFDNLKQRGLGETIFVNFINLPLYEIAKVVQWEDERWYYEESDIRFQRDLLAQIKSIFIKEQNLEGIRGLTPETRYYFFLTSLQRTSFREVERLNLFALSQAEAQKRIKEFENTFAGRLKTTIERAGGILIRFMKANNNSYMIHWKVKGSDQIVKSTIRDNMQILNLGYCASGHDREHTLASAIQLAKMYGELYITRE
jgi:hypothetical protein